MAFFKNDNGTLLVAPNRVDAPTFTLRRARPEDRDRTVDGWHWYDTGQEARTAYGLPTLRQEIRREIIEELGLNDLVNERIAERREDE